MKPFAYLWFEFTGMFLLLPLLVYFDPFYAPKIPILVLVTIFSLFVYFRHLRKKSKSISAFAKKRRTVQIRHYIHSLMIRFAFFSVVVGIFTWLFYPDSFFQMPFQRPRLWLMILLLYPLLSALPQEFLYRTFFFERYQALFKSPEALILASTLTFSFLHIIYDNWLAVVFTLIGGYFFSKTYRDTQNLWLATLEHSLYGLMVFTVGLGTFFFE